jgi:hypothetical protein
VPRGDAQSVSARFGRHRHTQKSPIKTRESPLSYLALSSLEGIFTGSVPQLGGGQVFGTFADSVFDVVLGKPEFSALGHAAQGYMNMGVVGVVVCHSYPFKGTQLALHPLHEFARVFAEVHPVTKFRRNDNFPEASISGALPPVQCGFYVDAFTTGVEA